MNRLLRRTVARQLEEQVERLIKDKNLKIVAVTGSVGKTSTKLAIASVLGQKFRVLAHEGNYNTEVSLPLAIFGLETPGNLKNPIAWLKIMNQIRLRARRFEYGVLVLELGVDHPGEMDIYLRYLQPDVGVITAVAPVHLEGFGSIEAVEVEKWKLAPASRSLVINGDDDRLVRLSQDYKNPLTKYGPGGEVHFSDTKLLGSEGIEGSLYLGSQPKLTHVQTHVIGEHSLRALEAAGAVGLELGLTPEEIKAGVEAFRPVKGRMNTLPGKHGSLIIDDSYNASPDAAEAALKALVGLPGRHLAILGSMNELGDHAEAEHRKVGRAAAEAGLAQLITVGEQASWIAESARAAGLKGVEECISPYEAGRVAERLLQQGDVILVKGSQNGVFTEEAVKLLLAHAQDAEQLVRQSSHWQKVKQQQFGVQ